MTFGGVAAQLADHEAGWPAWISASAATVTTIVVVLSAIFALHGLWDARRTRYGQLITELQRQWTEPAVVESIRLHTEYPADRLGALVAKMFGPSRDIASLDERRAWSKLALWANLIESMGVLVSEKTITPRVVYKMWGGGILAAWSSWELAVRDLRVYDDEPDTFQYFEEIALAMRTISDQRKRELQWRAATASDRRERRAEAEAEPEKHVRSSAPPSHSVTRDVRDSSASVIGRAFGSLLVLLVVSAIWRMLRSPR